MKWNRPDRKGVGVEFWQNKSDYVKTRGNTLEAYANSLETQEGRSEIFQIILDFIKEKFRKEDKIRVHEMGCNSGYNLEFIRENLFNLGFKNVLLSGNDSWEDVIFLGKKNFPNFDLKNELSSDFLKKMAVKKEKIDVVFSHSHLIHLVDEDLDLLYPAIRKSFFSCFFFEDFDLIDNFKKLSVKNQENNLTFHSENLNSETKKNKRKIKIFRDAHIFSFVLNNDIL